MKYTIGLIFLILITSCNKKQRVFDKAEIDNGEFEIYFTPMLDFYDSSSGLELYDRFKIDNNEIVKEIINTWEFEIVEKNKNLLPLYYIELSKNNKTYISRWLNDSLSIILGPNHLKFNKKHLDKYSSYFKPIESKIIVVKELLQARKLLEIIPNINGYLPYHNENLKHMWEKFSGTIAVEYPTENLPEFDNTEDVVAFLNKELAGISKVELSEWIRNYTDETAYLKILCESDISNQLPENFKLIENWIELKNLEITVYNLSYSEITYIGENYGIDIVEIKNINNR